MGIDYQALLQSFLAESEEGLASMEEALMVLERRPRDEEAVATVFRVAHTLKGTAGMFDFSGVERLAHAPEELLDRLRQHSLEGQSQAVIKPLAKLFRGLPGISGSTILPNGRVALILDVPGLLLLAREGPE